VVGQVPFMFKHAVDALACDGVDPVTLAMYGTPVSLLAGYGVVRLGSAFASEARNAVFAKVRLQEPSSGCTHRSLSLKVSLFLVLR
jgi:hypothetical protein